MRFFLVKRHKTFFGFGFKSFFLDWLYFYFGFGFWLSVRNGFLYFVFGFSFFYIFYFILANRLASIWPPFYIGLPHLASPVYLVIKDQFILFLFVIHSLLLLLLLLLLLHLILVKSSVFDCSYLQNVLELWKYAKHTW